VPVAVGVVVKPFVVVVVVPVPKTAPPPVVVAAVPAVRVPVQVAPVGQHATFREESVVQNAPTSQHAPP
jgi:hypothetical protein